LRRPLGRIKGRYEDSKKGILKKGDETASTEFVWIGTGKSGGRLKTLTFGFHKMWGIFFMEAIPLY
jgi:hypothetical protein